MNKPLRPLMTEKASRLAAANTYAFEIDEDMNKNQVSMTLEKIYKVKVKAVKVAKHKGKVRKVGKRGMMKQLPDKKIAYVTLKEGKIDIFPQS